MAHTGAVLAESALFTDPETYQAHYKNYLDVLKRGELPGHELRASLTSTWSCEPDLIALEPVRKTGDEEFYIARLTSPAIQVRLHVLAYSPIDHSFHSMSVGKEAIPWGLEFSYAGLVQRGSEVETVDHAAPNSQLFRTLQRWMRHQTEPALIKGEGFERRLSARISPSCKTWINEHPTMEGLTLV